MSDGEVERISSIFRNQKWINWLKESSTNSLLNDKEPSTRKKRKFLKQNYAEEQLKQQEQQEQHKHQLSRILKYRNCLLLLQRLILAQFVVISMHLLVYLRQMTSCILPQLKSQQILGGFSMILVHGRWQKPSRWGSHLKQKHFRKYWK